ncbi:MAG: hypothetical protein HC804_01730 [Anaerolineae bacterium]|nr:hypothetical protein [Anaerolineae bacterium]
MTTFAKVTDPERAERWREVFGTDEVAIMSPVPSHANLPGFDEPQLVYRMDLSVVTPEARARLVQQTAERFGLDTAVVDADLEREGMPILAEHVIVTSTDIGLLISCLLDDLEEEENDDQDWGRASDDDWEETWANDDDFENDW